MVLLATPSIFPSNLTDVFFSYNVNYLIPLSNNGLATNATIDVQRGIIAFRAMNETIVVRLLQ